MSVILDLDLLIKWLGPAGAKSGLQESNLSLKELVALARNKGLPVSPKPSRREIAHELSYAGSQRIEKSADDLLAMSNDALLKYFAQVKPTRAEIIKILSELGVIIG